MNYEKLREVQEHGRRYMEGLGAYDLMKDIPWLCFPDGYAIQPLPNFGGALARFAVRKIGTTNAISIYYDVHNALGIVDSPYWKIYPDVHGEVRLFLAGEEHELIIAVVKALETNYANNHQ